MANIATYLKAEISRIARKEIRADNKALKASTAKHRSEIAALKHKIAALETLTKRVTKVSAKPTEKASGEDSNSRRFSAKGFGSMRKRLGLTAAELARLIGVSAQSVYKWEEGKNRPRAAQIEVIAQVRGLDKKAAAAKLQELQVREIA